MQLPGDSLGTELLFFQSFFCFCAASLIHLYPLLPPPHKFFKLDVLYEVPGGCLAPAPGSHIVEELHRILRAVPTPAEHPVGILTTEHRDTWYQARERLRKGTYIGKNLGFVVVYWQVITILYIYSHTFVSEIQTPCTQTQSSNY